MTVCAIYNGCFADAEFAAAVRVAIACFNDFIIRLAAEKGIPVIDLRLICDQLEDCANPIDPSAIGGAKFAAAILKRSKL